MLPSASGCLNGDSRYQVWLVFSRQKPKQMLQVVELGVGGRWKLRPHARKRDVALVWSSSGELEGKLGEGPTWTTDA